jgi:hypothetical protein
VITNDARWTGEIKPNFAIAKAAFNKKKKKILSTANWDFNHCASSV